MPFVRHALITCALLTTTVVAASPVERSKVLIRKVTAGPLETCQSILLNKHLFNRPLQVGLMRNPVFKNFTPFVKSFGTWVRDSNAYVAKRPGVEWRVETATGRMTYEIELNSSKDLVTHIRRLADALLGPVRDGLDSDEVFAFKDPRSNRLVLDLPLSTLGVKVVFGFEGRINDTFYEENAGPRSYTSQPARVDWDEHAYIIDWLNAQAIGSEFTRGFPEGVLKASPRTMDDAVKTFRTRQSEEGLPTDLLANETVHAYRAFFAGLGRWQQMGDSFYAAPIAGVQVVVHPQQGSMIFTIPRSQADVTVEAARLLGARGESLDKVRVGSFGPDEIEIRLPLDRAGMRFAGVVRARVIFKQAGALNRHPVVTDEVAGLVREWVYDQNARELPPEASIRAAAE